MREEVAAALRSLPVAWSCSTVVHRDPYEEQVLLGRRVAPIDLLTHLELLEFRGGRR